MKVIGGFKRAPLLLDEVSAQRGSGISGAYVNAYTKKKGRERIGEATLANGGRWVPVWASLFE